MIIKILIFALPFCILFFVQAIIMMLNFSFHDFFYVEILKMCKTAYSYSNALTRILVFLNAHLLSLRFICTFC